LCSHATGSGESAPVDRELAVAELARRYLAGHGPADDRHLARWSGLPLRDARAGLEAIASELRQRDDGLLDLQARSLAAPLPKARLLGPFEPPLLGWNSRELLLGGAEPLVVSGGIFRPIALLRGRAVATWTIAHHTVELTPFAKLASQDRKALEADADDVVRFLSS
jgi:hypothetical protein